MNAVVNKITETDVGRRGDAPPSAARRLALEARVSALRQRYAELDGAELLKAMIEDEFVDRLALVSSFGAESAIPLHMVSRIKPDLPIIFLDTRKLFGETIRYRDDLIAKLGLTGLRVIRPDPDEIKKEDANGLLWARTPDACCALRKTRPLTKALEDFDAWVTGRKHFHSETRSSLPTIEHDGRHVKINPLVKWSAEKIRGYMTDHDLPPHPLVEDGFLSIGCMPCTRRVEAGEDVRAGRWSGIAKTECGIHLGENI
jgi:phosphoadenosine phosphosulfate reductase